MKKIAIITTHPIQYNAPWFALLARKPGIELKVFYTWSQRQTEFYDDNFGKEIQWDIPLLEGYDYTFVTNTAQKPGNKSFGGIQCPTLIAEIEAFVPTHLMVFGWNFKAHFKAMRYFKGKIPVLFRGDSTLLDYEIKTFSDLIKQPLPRLLKHAIPQLLKFKLRKLTLSFIYRYIDKALYVGSNNKAYFKAHGLKENQLLFVPHAIDNHRFLDNPDKDYTHKAIQWRRQLGIQDSNFVIIFAGKFETKKAPFLLLEAYRKLKSKTHPIKLIFIGNGPLENSLKSEADDDPNIFFLPFQNQSVMPIIYRLGNLFCLPSSGPGETWGLAINEAIACGTPVVVSDKVGCANNLVQAPPCFQFKSEDIDDLSRVLELAISYTNVDKSKTWNSFIEKWSFEVLTKKLIEAL